MRKKLLVVYSVKYSKEIELEVNENINWILEDGNIITDDDFPVKYDYLESQPEISDLPIPDTRNLSNEEQVEYIDGSFYVESFEQIEK